MQEIYHFSSNNIEDTIQLGRQFATKVQAGANVALRGNLGAGKTAFCKGVISELSQIPLEEICSPTFTLVEEYSGKIPIYHIDLYRIKNLQEAEEFPWEDYLASDNLCLIEWVENFPMLEKSMNYCILIEKKSNEEREFSVLKKEENGR